MTTISCWLVALRWGDASDYEGGFRDLFEAWQRIFKNSGVLLSCTKCIFWFWDYNASEMGKWLVIPINPVYVMCSWGFLSVVLRRLKTQPFGYRIMDIQLFSYPFKLRLCPGICWLSRGFKDVLDFCTLIHEERDSHVFKLRDSTTN